MGGAYAVRDVATDRGYTAALLPAFQGVVVPIRGQVAAPTGPGTARQDAIADDVQLHIRPGLEYMVPRPSP